MSPEVLGLKVLSELQEMLWGYYAPGQLGVRITSSSCDTQDALVCTVIVARDVLCKYGYLGVHDIHEKAFELVAEHGMPSVVVSVFG